MNRKSEISLNNNRFGKDTPFNKKYRPFRKVTYGPVTRNLVSTESGVSRFLKGRQRLRTLKEEMKKGKPNKIKKGKPILMKKGKKALEKKKKMVKK